jgi:hypothetical protein
MRKVDCDICHEEIAIVDLRASEGADPRNLAVEEEGGAVKQGVQHVMTEHQPIVQLASKRGKSAFDFINVSDFEPLDPQSRLPEGSMLTRAS